MIKRFVYEVTKEELDSILLKGKALEVLERKEEKVKIAVYEEIEGLKPTKVEEVSPITEVSFGPVEAGDFVIVPPWKKVIYIKPGMAFGTGLHPTTRLCLKALSGNIHGGESLLDVGTGSGILAIGAKLLGAGRVKAIDISPEAVKECRENARRNSVDIECLQAKPQDLREIFDIVVANLEMEIFKKELEYIAPLVGRIGIFSGIYREGELKEFESLLEGSGLKIAKVGGEEGWFCVEAVKDEKR